MKQPRLAYARLAEEQHRCRRLALQQRANRSGYHLSFVEAPDQPGHLGQRQARAECRRSGLRAGPRLSTPRRRRAQFAEQWRGQFAAQHAPRILIMVFGVLATPKRGKQVDEPGVSALGERVGGDHGSNVGQRALGVVVEPLDDKRHTWRRNASQRSRSAKHQ
nr:hypothetical protein [Mesorhizobium sp. ES1-4]